jgi:hypothetical protein
VGKAPETERIKLRATWFNNVFRRPRLDWGSYPAFSIWRAENFLLLSNWVEGNFHPTALQVMQFVTTLGVIGFAFSFAAVFREKAEKEIAKLQD